MAASVTLPPQSVGAISHCAPSTSPRRCPSGVKRNARSCCCRRFRRWSRACFYFGQVMGCPPLARLRQGSGVQQRIVDGEAFGSRRHQQRVIGSDKQGWRHPPLVQQALHRQGAGQLDRVIGP